MSGTWEQGDLTAECPTHGRGRFYRDDIDGIWICPGYVEAMRAANRGERPDLADWCQVVIRDRDITPDGASISLM